MQKNFKEVCKNCGKEYKVVFIKYPTKLEGRSWDTYYTCPYCKKDETDIHLSGDEDVRTEKIE